MQPERDVFSVRQLVGSIKGKEQDPEERNLDRLDHVVVRTDGEALTGQERACGTHFIESVTISSSNELQRRHRHRAGPDLAPAGACDIGRRADGGGGVRHVDGHRVGAGAVGRAVVHLEGEGRIGDAVRIERGREDEHVSVDLDLGDDAVRQDRRAVERQGQGARRRHGHDLHARQRGAGVRVGEAEVVRREGVRPVLARRHRVVGRRRGGVGGCGGDRAARRVGVAGERALGGAAFVLERDLHLDLLALVGGGQRVGFHRRARNVALVAPVNLDPLDGSGGGRKEGVRQPVHIRDGTRRRGQRLAHLRRARDPGLARHRVVHPFHVDGHRVGVVAVDRAIVHLEGEARNVGPVQVRRWGVFQLVEVVRGHRLRQVPRPDRRTRERERARARCRQRHDLDAHETVAGVRVGEAEVVRREGVVRVFVRIHKLLHRGRGGVGDGGGELDRDVGAGGQGDARVVPGPQAGGAGGGIGEDEGGAADHEGEGGGVGGDVGVDLEFEPSAGADEEHGDGVVGGVVVEAVFGEDGGAAASRGVDVVAAAEDAEAEVAGGEGGGPDLGLGLRGRGQGQQRGSGQQGQAGPRAAQHGRGFITRAEPPAQGGPAREGGGATARVPCGGGSRVRGKGRAPIGPRRGGPWQRRDSRPAGLRFLLPGDGANSQRKNSFLPPNCFPIP